jgi:2-polyprenyl-3-methyl-5-hydroxy-6-metoxy-1,4-benzoquinol methylase
MGLRTWLKDRFSRHALRIDLTHLEKVCAEHQVELWHLYAARERPRLTHVNWACDWIAHNCPRHAAIHEVGCGIGLNALWFAQHGFTSISGSDILPEHLAVLETIAHDSRVHIPSAVADGLSPDALATGQYDVVLALNWLFLPEHFSLEQWLRSIRRLLRPSGLIVFDAIDPTYANDADHQWHSADRHLPQDQRRPSEYRQRLSEEDITHAAHGNGFRIRDRKFFAGRPPRSVQILEWIDGP